MTEPPDPELSSLPPDSAGQAEDDSRAARDPLGIAAIVLGCVGIVVLGFVLAIVTALVAAEAGRRAREARRSMENAYIGFALAVLDAVLFLVLHYQFKLPAFAG
jgi:hypothetical protein